MATTQKTIATIDKIPAVNRELLFLIPTFLIPTAPTIKAAIVMKNAIIIDILKIIVSVTPEVKESI